MGVAITRPRGQQAVREAVLEAAVRLFCEKGPAATSMREIATLARVNHGLIHRHFGSKRALVQAVFEHLAERLTATGPFEEPTLDAALAAFGALEEQREFWIVLARAMLDGELAEVLESELPAGHRLVETLATALPDPSPLPARDVVAMSLAFSLGWLLLRDFIQAATDAGDDVPEKWFAAMASLLDGNVDPRLGC